MTSVLPAWKLELIEKKKKKEQDHRQKIEEEKTHKVSIPEWKRSLLEKKKEAASDSPETKEQGLCVNSVFGPRIVRKPSQTNLPNVNSSQRPVVKGDYEENKRNILQDINTGRDGPSLCSSPADANSCVTKAVEIPTEVEHKPNKLNTQREIDDKRETSRPSDVYTAVGKDSKVALGVQESEAKPDNENRKMPSVLSYRRMFEQSKQQVSKESSEPRFVKNTESRFREQNDERTTESTSSTVSSESHPSFSQLQISNKSAVDKGHSIDTEKSTRSRSYADSNVQKISAPKPPFASKPYKNFVSTPPWLKNTASRNAAFQVGNNNSVQEEKVVAKVNSEVQSAPNQFDTSDEKNVAVIESSSKEKAWSTIESDTKQRISFSNHSDLVAPSTFDVQKGTEKTVLPQEQTVEKHSIIAKPEEGNDKQKYIVIDSRNQQEPTSTSEKDRTFVNVTTDNVPQVPEEHAPPDTGNNVHHPTSIESLRSKFGSIGGYRQRTSSEENLFLTSNQAEQSGQVTIIRRSAELKRPLPPMKRWSADVLSLMSQPIDENDDQTSNLSPRDHNKNVSPTANQLKRPPPPVKRWTADVLSLMSQPIDDDDDQTSNLPLRNDTKDLSPTSNQLKRPPPPMKRWTADVITVMSRQTDDGTSNLSPRSDSSKKSSPSNSLTRGRSSSLVDIREEAGVDYFQHKPTVSQGIEHRVNKLIRRMSVSETQLNVEGEESDSASDDDTLNDPSLDLKIAASKEKDVHSPSPEHDVKSVYKRKHSISSDIEHRVTELFHRQLSQQSDTDESEGEKSIESDGKIAVVQMVDDVRETVVENLKTESVSLVSTEVPVEFDSSTKDAAKEDANHIIPESKPLSGSVHKLSALFGSSILKPKKKEKNAAEEKMKDKASKLQKIPSTEKSTFKSSSAEKDDSKKSNLFSKSPKSEGKSGQKEKQQSNTSIFPWLRKNDKEKESTGGNKTKKQGDTNQKNSSNSSDGQSDTLPISALGLQPVRKSVKVEQRLVGNVKIISNASHEQTPPKGVYHKTRPSVQIPEPEKEKIPAKMANDSKADTKRTETQIPTIVTQYWNGNQKSPNSEKNGNDSVPVTSIDEVPVSAIDIPETGESDVTVSVIDVPASPEVRSAGKFSFFNGHKEETQNPDDDISVSVIDLPSPRIEEKSNTFGYLEADELSDGSDEDEVEGSYDFATGEITHQVNGDITQGDDDDDDDDEEEDDEEDDEDVPISYIGAAPQYPVPKVVFDSEPVQLKSCLSPKTERKKMNRGKVSFKGTHVVHDYLSEEAVIAVYDEYENTNKTELKTLQNYQPAGLVNMEKKLGHGRGQEQGFVTQPQPLSNGDNKAHDATASKRHPEIKYADEGQGFTDSSGSASALLF